MAARARHQDPRCRFAEQRRDYGETVAGHPGHIGADADAAAVERALGQRDRQAALRAIVRGLDAAVANQLDDEYLQRRFALQVKRRRFARHQVVHGGEVFAAAELAQIIAQQDHRGANRLEYARHGLRRIVEQSDDAEHRGRKNRAALGFVVKADVAAGDRHLQGPARVADAADGLADLPHDLRALGIAEVEVVGRANRLCARARDVSRRLGDGEHRALIRIQITEPPVAIDRNGEAAARVLDADDGRRHAGLRDGVGADGVIVLPVGPSLAGNRRDGDQTLECLLRRHGRQVLERNLLDALLPERHLHRTLVDRRFIGQRAVRHVGDERAALVNLEARALRHFADLDGVQIPLLEHSFDFVLAAALDDEEHALLRFGQHDLVRRHAGFALRHVDHVHGHADAAAGAHLRRRAREARGAHVLDADHGARLHHLETGFHQQLFHERIADLHRGPLLL